MTNLREHPKFLFLKEHIERYVSNGGFLGRLYLQSYDKTNPDSQEIRRCPLGVVAFNCAITLSEMSIYDKLLKENDLSCYIAFGFDSMTGPQGVIFPSCQSNEDFLIGQEIARFCLENGWIEPHKL